MYTNVYYLASLSIRFAIKCVNLSNYSKAPNIVFKQRDLGNTRN